LGDNGQWSLKLWQLLHTYWLPNSYWNWQEYVFSVMLISVLNIQLTSEWHKAIQLNYINTRTKVAVVLRVPSTLHVQSQRECAWACCRLNDGHAQCTGNTSRKPGIVHGTARRPHFSLAIISITVQLWIQVFLVRSVYFNLKNILPKSGTFLLGHSVYDSMLLQELFYFVSTGDPTVHLTSLVIGSVFFEGLKMTR
jgi:hypothetical protein